MQKNSTIWSKNFIIVFFANAVLNFGQFMVNNLLPSYLNTLGLSATFVGFIISMFSYTALGFRPITGPLISGWNKKKFYIILMAAVLLSYVGYGIAGSSIAVIMISRLLHGFGQGAVSALALVMISDWLPSEKLASGVTMFGLGGVVGSALGPAIGLTFAEKVGYNAAFLCSACLFAVCFVTAFLISSDERPDGKISFTLKGMISMDVLIPALLLTFTMIVRASTNYLVVFLSDERHIEGIKFYFFANAAANLVFRPMIAKLADKRGIPFAMVPTFVFFAATMLAIAFCHNTFTLMLVAVLHAVGFGSIFAFLQAIAMKVAKPEDRGAASSTSFIGIDLGDLIGPIVWGVLIDSFGYATMFLCNLIPIVLSAVIFFIWAPKHKKELDPAYSEA